MVDYLAGVDSDGGRAEVSPVMLFDASGVPLAALAQTPNRTLTNRSISAGVAAQNAMIANANRMGWKIKNDTLVDVWINFTGTAVAAAGSGSIKVAAGGYLASEPGNVESTSMSIIAAAAATPITIYEFG